MQVYIPSFTTVKLAIVKVALEVNPDPNNVAPIKNLNSSAPTDAQVRVAGSPVLNCTLLSVDDSVGLIGPAIL